VLPEIHVHRPFCRLPYSSTKQADNGPQGTICPNRPGSAQTSVVAVETAEVAGTLAQLMLDGTEEAVKAVVADVTEAASTLWTASVRCDIVAEARSLDSLAQERCMVTCYLTQKGSGTLTVVASEVDGMLVAGAAVVAGDVVRMDRYVQVPGYMASAVALELAGESDTVHAAVAR